MISRKSINYLILILSINILFGGSEASLAAESSIIPFQPLPSSKPMLHLGGVQDSSGIRPISGIQIQPTTNFLLGGILSPQIIDNDLSIYYQPLTYFLIYRLYFYNYF